MALRFSRRPHCAQCGRQQGWCVCDRLPVVDLPWPLLVVQHHIEARKPSNTARCLVAMVRGARLLRHGAHPRDHDERDWQTPPPKAVVLFPSSDAEVLTPSSLHRLAEDGRCLIVLDGTWRQARRMERRLPGLEDLPRLRLPETEESSWRMRFASAPGRLCTMETIVRLAEIASTPDAPRMRAAFNLLHDAQMKARPLLPGRDYGLESSGASDESA